VKGTAVKVWRKFSFYLLLAGGISLLASPAFGADMLSIFKAAVDHDPDLKYAHFESLASNEVTKQALAGFLPSASLQASRAQTIQNITSSDNTVFAAGKINFSTNELTVKLSQPIFHFDAFVGYGQAKAGERKADAELSAARQDMMIQVLDTYLKALFAQDDLMRALREKDAIGSEVHLVQARYASGQASLVKMKEAKARLGMVEALVLEARDARENGLEDVKILAGISIDRLAPLEGDVSIVRPDPMDADDWIKAAGQQNFHVQAENIAVEIAKDEISRLRAGHYPTIDLVGSYNFRDAKGTLFGGGSKVQTTEAMVQLNVPLLDGGRVLARTGEARFRYQQALQKLEKARRKAVRSASKAYIGVVNGSAKLEALKQSIEAQKVALSAQEKGLRSGLNTSTEVLDARRDLFVVQRDYAKSRYEYLKNMLRLKQAAGTLNEKDIEVVNNLLRPDDGDDS